MTALRIITPRGYWRGVPEQPERREMTVCIAAACGDEGGQAIVLCTDWRISGALGSADTMLKIRQIGQNWHLLTSGSESDINAIVLAFRRAFPAGSTIDETNVPTIVRNVLNERKREKAEEFVRGKYAIGYDDLLNLGKDKLPADLYREALLLISEIEIGCSCIIAGFDSSGHNFILETNSQCRVLVRDDFATIGEGAYLAQTALLQRGHISSRKLSETIYCVYEAKRYAEKVTSVGDVTSLHVIYPRRSRRLIEVTQVDDLKPYFAKFGPQRIEDTVDKVLKLLKDG